MTKTIKLYISKHSDKRWYQSSRSDAWHFVSHRETGPAAIYKDASIKEWYIYSQIVKVTTLRDTIIYDKQKALYYFNEKN